MNSSSPVGKKNIFLLILLVQLKLATSAASPNQNPSFRQEEDDDPETTAAYQWGPQVAQIITGALTGSVGDIFKGSFNLVNVPEIASIGDRLAGPSPTALNATSNATTIINGTNNVGNGTAFTTTALPLTTNGDEDEDDEDEPDES